MIQFYCPDIKNEPTLPEEESAHCCRVLRQQEGDTVQCIDGAGGVYECVITEAHPKHVGLRILNERHLDKAWCNTITLAVAPTKNIDRIEWLLEKIVEIGVDRVVLLKCEHSERKNVREDRLEKIIVSAMKQSLKATKPTLESLMPIGTFLKEVRDNDAIKLMGYCDADYPRLRLVDEYKAGRDVIIMVGPEGDFSPSEVEQAVASGFIPVTFGDTRLRTETAALYGVTAVHVLNSVSGMEG